MIEIYKMLLELERKIGNGAKVSFSLAPRSLVIRADWTGNYFFQTEISLDRVENDPALEISFAADARAAYRNAPYNQPSGMKPNFKL